MNDARSKNAGKPAPRTKTPDSRRKQLLSLLADGAPHSGENLAHKMQVTRSAIWKLISKLRALNIDIEAVPGQGYRLPYPIDPYDKLAILKALAPDSRLVLSDISTLLTVDSTSRFLVDADSPSVGHALACVAEVQTAGRGRRGRSWIAPFGSGVCLSLAWQFAEPPPTFSALGLAVGVAVVRALRRFKCDLVKLKWPNDLVSEHRKLAGILIDMRGEAGGPARVVIGIGINMRLPTATRLELAKQQATLVTDLHELLGPQCPNRNALVAAIIDELLVALHQFQRDGFTAFESEWRSYDSLSNCTVRVMSATEIVDGIARGAAADGALLVEVSGEVRRFMSGDVSLRAVIPKQSKLPVY